MIGLRQYLTAGLSSPVIFCVALCLLLTSSLIRGGNRYTALIGLEWLALLLLVLIMARPTLLRSAHPNSSQLDRDGRLESLEWLLLLSPVGLAIFYLFPLPEFIAAIGRGRPYLAAQSLGVESAWRVLSVTPQMTQGALLVTLPVLAMYLFGRTCRFTWGRRICMAFVAVAVFQAVLGLMQTGPFKGLYFGVAFASGGAVGTFANSNHFANFLGMAVPVTMFFLFERHPQGDAQNGNPHGIQTLVFGTVLFVLICAVLASRSRAGLFTMCLVFVLALWFQKTHDRTHKTKVKICMAMAALVFLFVGAIFLLGAEKTSARWMKGDFWGDANLRIKLMWSSAVAAQSYLPFGSGPGTYADVYPAFQPVGLFATVEYAHNDYLQWLVEVGVFAPILFAVLGGLCWRQWLKIKRGDLLSKQNKARVEMQKMCILGFLAIALHSVVDFNFRIPANAMAAALLLGVYMRPVRNEQQGVVYSRLSHISHL